MNRYPILRCELPGAGKQLPVTDAVQFHEAFVVGATQRALRLKIPSINRDEWLARSQVCGTANDGTDPDIDQFSTIGAHGTVRVPKYIAERWLNGVRT